MSTWKKSSPALTLAFNNTLAATSAAGLEKRQMFGYPCAFVNGHMAVGLHEQRLVARVPSQAQAHPCVILGRRMKSYAAIDEAEVLQPGVMQHWVALALAFTATLPPKPAQLPPSPAAAKADSKVSNASKIKRPTAAKTRQDPAVASTPPPTTAPRKRPAR